MNQDQTGSGESSQSIAYYTEEGATLFSTITLVILGRFLYFYTLKTGLSTHKSH